MSKSRNYPPIAKKHYIKHRITYKQMYEILIWKFPSYSLGPLCCTSIIILVILCCSCVSRLRNFTNYFELFLHLYIFSKYKLNSNYNEIIIKYPN